MFIQFFYFRCYHPTCNFSTSIQNSFLAHIGTQHQPDVQYHYQQALLEIKTEISAPEQTKIMSKSVPSQPLNQSTTACTLTLPSLTTTTTTATKSSPSISKNISKSVVQPCPVCSEKFTFEDLLVHAGNEHFAEALARDCLPTEAPFKCPNCPHYSQSHLAALRHWLIFHNMMEAYTSAYLARLSNSFQPKQSNPQWCQPVKSEFSVRNIQVHKRMECLMCDDVKVVGSTPLDLHKHLVEKHFRDRLLDLIPSIGNTIDGKPRYCCPFQGCFYEHHYKWIIAKHYGIKHRVAKQFYEEVIGVCKSKPKVESEPNQPIGPTLPVKSVPNKVQPVKMNGTNSSANQSDYQSVITLKEQLQAQSQQLYHRQLQPWQLSQKLKGYQQPRQYFASRQSADAPSQEKQLNNIPTIKQESIVDQHKGKPLKL